MIYLYWEDAGSPRHWYYSLCLETVRRHNEVVLLGTDDVGTLPDGLRDVYVIHRVDWIRKDWVARHGGLWLDMDFVCFESLKPLEAVGAAFDFVGFKEWPGNWMDNFFAGRPGSKVLRHAADYALERCRRGSPAWLSTNADAIADALGNHPWGRHLQIPTHLVSPVSVLDPGWFTADLPASEDLGGFDCFGFMTSYHGLRDWLANQTRESFLAGGSRLAGLFRRALG